jgi:hypothetical protein
MYSLYEISSRYSSVSKATSHDYSIQTGPRDHPASSITHWTGGSYMKVEHLEHEPDNSTPSRTEVKKEWNCIHSPQFFIAWCLGTGVTLYLRCRTWGFHDFQRSLVGVGLTIITFLRCSTNLRRFRGTYNFILQDRRDVTVCNILRNVCNFYYCKTARYPEDSIRNIYFLFCEFKVHYLIRIWVHKARSSWLHFAFVTTLLT